MQVDQQVADEVTLALGIGGQIDHAEEMEAFFSYVTDDGKVLIVTKEGWYDLQDMNERPLQRGSVAHLLKRSE